jgi:hypothetical protein
VNTISEKFTTPKNYPTEAAAQAARNARAKELRAQGYTVKCKKWDFGGMGYGASFTIDAVKADTAPAVQS